MHHPKIVIISGKHPVIAKSGYARYSAALAKQLTRLGADVHVYCAGTRASVTQTAFATIHVVKIPFLRLFSGREMATFPFSSILLARNIKTADLVWGIGPWTLAGILARRAPVCADYFTSLSHEYGFSLFSPLEKIILTKSDRIITHYRSTERILRKEFGLTKFFRLPYAVDTKKIVHKKNLDKILLTVCRNDARKGIRYLIEAYVILRKRGIEFRPILVGPGQPMGPVDDLTSLFARAYAFVLPSLEEGSGSIAILEAMAAGLPIIATNVDGIPEDVKDGLSGILVPPANPHALADAIEKLLANPSLARRLGQNARSQYQKKYSERNVRTNLKKILTSFDIAR